MVRRLRGAGILALLAAAACGGAAPRPTSPAASRIPAVSGGTAAQRAPIVRILRSIRAADVERVRAPAGARLGGRGVQLVFTLPPAAGAGSVEPLWHAFVTAGVFRDLSAARRLPLVAGMHVAGSGGGVLGGGRQRSITAQVDVRRIRARLRRMGLGSAEVTRFVLPTRGDAVRLTATARRPAAFLARYPDPVTAALGDVDRYEGTYVELRDGSGRPFLVSAHATRAAHGIGWTRRGLRGGITGGGPMGLP